MSKRTKILLVEDDISFGKILRDYLTLNNLEVTHMKDGVDGWNAFRNHHFDLCILDVMMPKRDGFELAAQIRQHNSRIPLIFLTAKAGKADVLNGFESGADDYLVKPVDADILLLKVRAMLKRLTDSVPDSEPEEEVHINGFTFNYSTRCLYSNTSRYVLSPKEADVLRVLCANPNVLVKREDILRNLWKEVNYFTGRSLDVYIAKLRKYLQEDETISLSSLPKSGYILSTGRHRSK